MNKFVGKKSTFAFLSCALITYSLITNAGEGKVVTRGNNAGKFHNDAERLLPKAVRYLIGAYASDDTVYVIRNIHTHPSPRFQELLKNFDIKIPITNQTCSHKKAELLDSGNPNGSQSLRLTDLCTNHGVPVLPDIIANSGPLAGYTILAVVKKFPDNTNRRQLLFQYTCERRGNEYTITSKMNRAALVEAETDIGTLRIAGFLPPQSKYCPALECWQLTNCQQHDNDFVRGYQNS